MGGGEREVVFGDVEEFGGVFGAGFVGYGGADAFVAWMGEASVIRIGVWDVLVMGVCAVMLEIMIEAGLESKALTRPTDPPASSAPLCLPEAT